MNRQICGVATVAALLGLAACGSTSTPAPGSAAGKALVEEATTGVTFSDDFNPFDSNSTARAMNLASILYEPLYELDALDPTAAGSHPWLATGYTFSNGGDSLAITVRQNVKFNDGSAFSANDVAATFKAIKDQPKLDWSGVPVQTVDPSVSGNVVTLTFGSPQYTNLWSILGSTFIVQSSVAQQLTTNPTMAITKPVGTGPFMLGAGGYTSQLITLTPNPHYWGGACNDKVPCTANGKPPESKIEVPYIADNNTAAQQLASGNLDWAGNDVPNVYQTFVNLNPLTNHAWFASGNTVTLVFNLTGPHAVPALKDAAVRRAISMGIDRQALAQLGESGYEYPATSSGGLILPNQKVYLSTNLANDLPATPETSAAKASNDKWQGDTVEKELTGDGWTPPARWGTSTEVACDGTVVANCWHKGSEIIQFAIYDPQPFSDYWEDATLISQELQSEGMAVTTSDGKDYNTWNGNLVSGNFQAAIHWGQGGNIPYVQFYNWLSPASQQAGSGNFGGVNDPAATALLHQYEGTDPSNTAQLTQVVQGLESYMSTNAPDVPLLYGADWNVFSSAKYVGWPSQSNPYMNPSPNDPEMPYILMSLNPATS